MKSYETDVSGIRIVPGCWRPHYPFEQIAWVSPPWPSQDYLWVDFPEAIFSDIGLLYLSHVNPSFPVLFPRLPKVPWKEIPECIAVARALPNCVGFGGSLIKESDSTVAMELHISNGSDQALKNIGLQTCIFLRAIKEFSAFTNDNKFVHLPDHGWLPFPEAVATKSEEGKYRLGWRSGHASADLPVMVTVSGQGEHLVAVTWYEDTYSLVGNPGHPCMHADPAFPGIGPGETSSIRGKILFFGGSLEEFADLFSKSQDLRRS